jgi:predicted phosphoadenosine phosphosulfate sulfurtransferase
MGKISLPINVLEAARARVSVVFDRFAHVYLSGPSGKDSTVMLHVVAQEARRRGRKIGVLYVDLEAQYKLTIDCVRKMLAEYADVIDPYWVALPLNLRNAVSMLQPYWTCWDPAAREAWVRQPEPEAIVDGGRFPFFRAGMEFEEFVAEFGAWYGKGQPTACFVGIRTAESLNRWRSLTSTKKTRFEGHAWTTWKGGAVYNAYPIYDWSTEDLWTYTARERATYNALYDKMHLAGLTPHQMRICQPYGDDQRKGLWLYHVIEPESWARVVARVSGANGGALYAQESGNILGNRSWSLPAGHTWKSYSKLLLGSLPPEERDHYENKIAVFVQWYRDRGFPNGIPDAADPKEEAAKKIPSWRRICKAILKNDRLCKSLSFTQQKSTAFAKYQKVMKARRQKWGAI